MNTTVRTPTLAQEQTRKAAIGYFYGRTTVPLIELQKAVSAFGMRRGLSKSELYQITEKIRNEVAKFKVSGS